MKKNILCYLVLFLFSSLSFAQSISGHVEAPSAIKQLVVFVESGGAQSAYIPETHIVSQKDTEFHPTVTVIAAGDKIQWVNDETKEIDHNIFSLSPVTSFDLGLGEKNSRLEQVFKNIGVVNYYCSVHKNMEGKVIVVPNRHYQLLDQPGDFKIDNLPEGNWTLKAVVLHLRYKTDPISLVVGNSSIEDLVLKVVKK